jgi:hypothetical protein
MPPKKHLPAPIDRPLSRAYLRQFTGWSTAYPPGASQPTSLRKMKNMLVNREGSVRIRPGLRLVSRSLADGMPFNVALDREIVGTYETFYLNTGEKAVLFAYRVPVTNEVEFQVGVVNGEDIVVNEVANISTYFTAVNWDTTPKFSAATTYVKYLQIDNKIIALSNAGETMIVFRAGTEKTVIKLETITKPEATLTQGSRLLGAMATGNWINTDQSTYPDLVDDPQPDSLFCNTESDNDYMFGFFYTYSNEIGETGASDVWITEFKRPFGAWSWRPATGGVTNSEPNPALPPSSNPNLSGDQYFLQPTGSAETGFITARDQGATKINYYMFTWSKQDSVPVEAFLIGSKDIGPTTLASQVYFQVTPATRSLGVNHPVPNTLERYNSTKVSCASQGLVAADRLVLVGDPTALAVIRWTTNEQGNYLNLSPNRGGGYKTLTSGNMQVPVVAKLWQNPQSADTITVLNSGSDGHSTAYYMAPAQVASQSDATNVMGFEETTATPGTVSPYGCEVANNALFHPLEDQLMKSTASNYNINHKAMTDLIAPDWRRLINKHKIVSCFFDQRIYYLVHNPNGEALEEGCNGNEVWTLDMSAEGGAWSRWTTQGVSMRKIVLNGQSYLSLIRPDGIFVFDPNYYYDEVHSGASGNGPDTIAYRAIAWEMETNTQGANRAHDAWAHLQQLQITLGSFVGELEWGVRGWDRHGQPVDFSKLTKDRLPASADGLQWDFEDQLQVKRDMKEWFFYAHSVEGMTDDGPGTLFSRGQITLVQYRYAPVSVNVGYEMGSIETFEYGRDAVDAVSSNTLNGVPIPFNDPSRP